MDWALFFSALISSTLFPGGSEALLVYRLQETTNNPYILVLTVTLGNVLGSVITYYMGKYGFQMSHEWFQISDKKVKHAEQQFNRWGAPALLFAWLPIIGDPLCLIAGSLRYPFLTFVILIGIGKLARYACLAWLLT